MHLCGAPPSLSQLVSQLVSMSQSHRGASASPPSWMGLFGFTWFPLSTPGGNSCTVTDQVTSVVAALD